MSIQDVERLIDEMVERERAIMTYQDDDGPACEEPIWLDVDQPEPND